MKPSITGSLFLCFFVVILAWSPAYAAKQVATVVAARGDVQALDIKGKGRALAIQAPIFEEDTIKTSGHSRVQIMFSDNTLINLGNETTMKIAEYRWQADQKDGALKTQIKEGTFRVMGGALAKEAPQNFKTETPTATIGIRGSMYAGLVTPNFLSVVFQGGKGIDVTNEFGTVAISKPGFGTKVALAKPPLPPMKFTAKEMGELNKALGGNGAGENGNGEDKGKKDDKTSAPKEEHDTSTAPTSADMANLSGEKTTIPPIPPVIPNVIKIGDDKTQDVIGTVVDNTVANTVLTPLSLTGNYRIFMRDNIYDAEFDYHYSTFVAWDSGAVNATFSTTLSGTGSLQASFVSNGAWLDIYDSSPVSLSPFLTTFGPYTHPGFTPTATSYNGFTSFTDNLSYNDPDAGLLTMSSTNYVDPVGQFFYNTMLTSLGSAPEILTGSLVYAGVPSGSIPTTGIDTYFGHLIYNSTSSLTVDADMEETKTAINYYNKRLIGRSSDNGFQNIDDGAIFFGTVAANGTANVTILAGGGNSYYNGGTVSSAYGSATATLYGSFQQGLAFTAAGNDYDISTLNTPDPIVSDWQATGAAMRAATREYNTPYPTSPITYTGFFIGVGDLISNGYVNRIYANSAPSDATITVNPTTGVLSGTIANLDDLYYGISTMPNLTIGGSQANSAYVANDDMVAILAGGAGLRDHGNFLVTAGPQAPEITNASNDFMTWGYWELAYVDGGENNNHLFGKQAFFVIGQQTPAAYLNSILNTASFTGSYTGKAFGVQIDDYGQFTTPLSNGTTQLSVNFPAATAANSVTGTISFNEAILTVNSAANSLTNTGFNAYVSNVNANGNNLPPIDSQVNGTFYGPNAEALGGSFHAKMGTAYNGVRYLGVFGGNR